MAEESVSATAGQVVARLDDDGDDLEWADLRSLVAWVRSHPVALAAIAMIAVQLIWKAQFLNHLYFRQDDFHDFDLAIEHPFSWSYLTFIGAGHLIIGLRMVAWFLVRISIYNYGLAEAVSLAFVAAAGLAGYRALRTLFGEQPKILIPLAFYLVTPLTMPDLGWWSSAMESVPLQLATFMAVTAHVRYVRTGRTRQLAAAIFWVVFGLIFFEKAMVLPPLLFAITAAFLADRRTLLGGALDTLLRFWKAWLIYALVVIGYAVLLAVALHTSAALPQAPGSSAGVLEFMGDLVKDTLLPGVLGGPWQWYVLPDSTYALAATSAFMASLSLAVAAVVIVVSVLRRRVAWRAWAILAVWVLAADMLPVILGRINAIAPIILGLETRYVADAAPVLAICVGLAFWPVAGSREKARYDRREQAQTSPNGPLRNVTAALVGLIIFGSLWSVQSYSSVTTGAACREYIANARQALKLAPPGTLVLDRPVPASLVIGLFGRFSLASTVLGDMAQGTLAGKLHWISGPEGTVNDMYEFGPDGRLYPVWVYPTKSVARTKAQGCWPERHGRIRIPLLQPSSIYTGILRIGYFWDASYPTYVTVKYGHSVKAVLIKPGLNSAFVSESGGNVSGIAIARLAEPKLCVGDVEVGNLEPSNTAQPIPSVPVAVPGPG